ncbi:PREDICTED: neuropeptide Y receptor-like isoform X1 [Acropora digitifera]|uniref:neuropeptide Y receptor-like isoform X1 n=1 Tax=Acropora digitifera TaxID=70779 RepID=UPI00077A71DB|nr:PREDICTED: neuropeptide Y receptor-like isoform X1 [Acropora digitifera]
MDTSRNEPSCSVSFNLAEHKIGVTIALCILFVASLLGNCLIGVVIYKTPTLRKPIDFLIVNMAMSDVLFSLIAVPVALVHLLLHSWVITKAVLASITCKVTPYLADVSLLVSVQSLVVIAVDRFVAVVFPLRVSLLTSKRCLLCILSMWVVSMLVAIPRLLSNITFEFDGKYLCVTDWKEALGDGMSIDDFYLSFALLFVNFPGALFIMLYAAIFTKLKSQKIPRQGSKHCERQRVKRNRNVSRMAVAIVLKFMACQLPSTVIVLLSLHSANLLPCTFLIYLEILVFVSFAYSAVNLFICLAFSGKFSCSTQSAKPITFVHKCP